MRRFHCARIAATVSLLSALLASACGSSASSETTVAPSPTPPTLSLTYVNMAGTWTGSLSSSNYATRSVSMTVAQTFNCVDGAWSGSPSEWTGAISGFALETGYTGQISIELALNSGERCRGVGDVSGPVGAADLEWTLDGFSVVGRCSEALPRNVVIRLHR
jgi:hypothetical protein